MLNMNEIKNLRKINTNDYNFFEIILDHCNITENIINRLVEKQEKHGDGWMYTAINQLRNRVKFLYDLYDDNIFVLKLEQKSLLDLINQSILLLIRLKQKENYLKDYD